jgi:two-component system sensor histidine kinase DctS
MEANERQEQLIADTLWVEQTARFQLERDEESIALLAGEIIAGKLPKENFVDRVSTLLSNRREMTRLVWLDAGGVHLAGTEPTPVSVASLSDASRLAHARVRETGVPQYSAPARARTSSAPLQMDYHVPLMRDGAYSGGLIVSYSPRLMLNEMVPWWFAQDNAIALLDGDDQIIEQRAAGGPGLGVYTHRRALDLPGAALTLHTNSTKSAPKLLPNLLVGSVIALLLGLAWSLLALWRDIHRRLAAEGALRQQVAFRSAMENSLLTGLRARDLEGRVTYVNPAFCDMVGLPKEQLVGLLPPMPYWAPEVMAVYQERVSQVLAGRATPQFETIFQRANGERFPVLIFESPLLDEAGIQTGWMGSILDLSERQRAEEVSREQLEKLQASARLASMGEIASTLAHELNQPLAAISSYTTGALNLLDRAPGEPVDVARLKPALEKAKAQAQRAGQIIRSVHTFVKQRAPAREALAINSLLDGVMALVELQAQQFFVTIEVGVESGLAPVLADRVLLEQVLLNLTRNAIEAMQDVPRERRLLRIEATSGADASTISVAVIDQGHGIAADVAERLFSPFFSTKAEGMGMGLKICRTTIEFHGGTLCHAPNPAGGTIFGFSLPIERDHAAHP